MKVGGEYYFYQNDHLGTPQKMTAVNGAVVWSAKYSSFGDATVDLSSSITNNLRFPGQYFDQETDLHYNYHRYYDYEIGRYLRTDPIGLDGGFNLYAYVLNSPVKLVDPLGLTCTPPAEMKKCLEIILNVNISAIKVNPDSTFARLHGKNTAATTRKNNIYLNKKWYPNCKSFWADKRTVLHEYFHVVHQWNTGELTVPKYIWESMKNGYWNNKYEVEARNFANRKLNALNECMKCPDLYNAAGL